MTLPSRQRVRMPYALAMAAAALTVLAHHGVLSAQAGSGDRWLGTWMTAEVGRPQNPPPLAPAPAPFMNTRCPALRPPVAAPPGQTFAPPPFIQFSNQTLRQIVRTSIGGSKARVILSNAYGTAPVTSTALAITVHNGAYQTNYISETGNHVGKTTLPTVGKTQNWFLLSRVDVVAPDAIGAMVAFGDSITDGFRSTADANNRWPDQLARRFTSQGIKMAVLNAGISGNRVLGEASLPAGFDVRAVGAGINALARFERHVLSLPGVTHVVVLEGINDIGGARQNPSPTAEDLIAGHKQLIEQAHAHGLKIYGATLTPFWGAAYYTDAGEAKRHALNEWIRTGKAYDGVIDFDKATRDPSDPKKFLAKYDSCDALHPSDEGYEAMADAIDLSLFKGSTGSRTSSR